jgi:hypothetical protein
VLFVSQKYFDESRFQSFERNTSKLKGKILLKKDIVISAYIQKKGIQSLYIT